MAPRGLNDTGSIREFNRERATRGKAKNRQRQNNEQNKWWQTRRDPQQVAWTSSTSTAGSTICCRLVLCAEALVAPLCCDSSDEVDDDARRSTRGIVVCWLKATLTWPTVPLAQLRLPFVAPTLPAADSYIDEEEVRIRSEGALAASAPWRCIGGRGACTAPRCEASAGTACAAEVDDSDSDERKCVIDVGRNNSDVLRARWWAW